MLQTADKISLILYPNQNQKSQSVSTKVKKISSWRIKMLLRIVIPKANNKVKTHCDLSIKILMSHTKLKILKLNYPQKNTTIMPRSP